jgi:hypothetical protein
MRYIFILVLAAILSSQASPASASITFYNQSGEPVWVAHMMDRFPADWPCSWGGWCCNNGSCSSISQRQIGWWSIYPGNWSTVTGASWQSLNDYTWLAEGTLHVWYGTGTGFNRRCVPDAAHDRCNPGSSGCPSGQRLLTYRVENPGGGCCLFCGSDDKDFILTL